MAVHDRVVYVIAVECKNCISHYHYDTLSLTAMCRFEATNTWTTFGGSVAITRDRGNAEGIGVTVNATHSAVHDSRRVSPGAT